MDLIINLLKNLHVKTNLAGCPFGFFKAFNCLKDKRFTFPKRLEILKYRQTVNLHLLLGKMLYGSLLTSPIYKVKFWLKWKINNLKYLPGTLRFIIFWKWYWIIKESLKTKEEKEKEIKDILASYGIDFDKIK
jgi:hypothetical protein